jgi:outer membrane protein
MTMKDKLKYIIPGGVLLLLVFAFAFASPFDKKIGYVDISYVFDNFQFKKERQAEFASVKTVRDKILDSLEYELNILNKQIELDKGRDKALISRFQVKRDDYIKLSKEFRENNDALTEQYDKEIIKQMNEYISEYGKEKGFDVLFGTEGAGNIMYAKESMNITKKVVEYINYKYQGGKN